MERTQDEIVNRVRERKDKDFFGFESGEYVNCLDFEHAREFLKEGTTKRQWTKASKDVMSPAEAIKDYMPFAWDKANNCRGISAARSIRHMIAWLWLDGKEWAEEIEDYEYYGKPQLVRICEEYDIDWKFFDDGEWRNKEEGHAVTADKVLGRS